MIGDGPCRRGLEEACRRHGVEDVFRFTGWVDPAEIADYYRSADMVVMPSETEGLALVYLETMASGGVLIASDIPAAREVVRHGETGLLHAPGETDQLAERVLEVAADPELRGRIGARARTYVEAHHAAENAIQDFADELDLHSTSQAARCVSSRECGSIKSGF